jgi:hypothetical protein
MASMKPVLRKFGYLVFLLNACVPNMDRSPLEYTWLSRVLSPSNTSTGQTASAPAPVTAPTTTTTTAVTPTLPTPPTQPVLSLSYSLTEYVLPANVALTSLSPTVTGIISTCAVTPTLPTGLTLDGLTCAISGTPTTQTPSTTYTISATSANGNASASISIRISSTNAYRVYGQPDFVSASINNGGISAISLNQPDGVGTDSTGNLVIGDYSNHRVLYYTYGSTTATRVYGQAGSYSTANSNNGGISASSLNAPQYATMDSSGNVYASDAQNRVLFFPNSGSLTAARVYGQFNNFTCVLANNVGNCVGTAVSADSLKSAQQIVTDKLGGVYITDPANNRVLYYAGGSTTATRVYGQFGSFTCALPNNAGGCGGNTISANSLKAPTGVALDSGGNLYISDSGNERVLYYPAGTTTATTVYGQFGSFSCGIANNIGGCGAGGITANNFNSVWMIAVDPYDNLYVTDYNNNRLLFFLKGSITATRVYGQLGSFTTGTLNNGGVTANSISQIHSVHVDVYGNVYVVDTGNNRVLMY